MPVTRSASRQSSSVANDGPVSKQNAGYAKRASKVETGASKGRKTRAASTKKLEVNANKIDENTFEGSRVQTLAISAANGVEAKPHVLPAVLSFSFEDAKRHLIAADPRFEDLFARMKCKPFEHLERVDSFRTLTVSILGQQISWLAARAITHKFIRLFDPSLPEKPTESGWANNSDNFFPSAHQVASIDVPTLRTAGLSARKAEYVQDLASRFADGSLSNEKIIHANDEVLYEMLTAVRGIGKWTVDMFAIFSLRRPDIMPAGDLGVQRGVVRWFLSLHSPKHPITISPRKLPAQPNESNGSNGQSSQSAEDSNIVLPELEQPVRATTPDAAAFPPAPGPMTPSTPVKGRKRNGTSKDPSDIADAEVPMPPPAFTPSINRTLNRVLPIRYHAPPLPEGLSVRELQSRLEGKKKIKGAILTPKEMEELTEPWRPYRSLGVYYMWALAEGDKY